MLHQLQDCEAGALLDSLSSANPSLHLPEHKNVQEDLTCSPLFPQEEEEKYVNPNPSERGYFAFMPFFLSI